MIRAFQWDLARQVERLDWLLAQLPRYAAWGYQELHLHLEDAVDYPGLPGVARRDALSWRQLEKLVKTAERQGIGVVPIVNLLGHTQYLIKTPEWRDLNECRDETGQPLPVGQICPSDPRTREVAARLLRDVAPLCTAGKVHVGLDESFHLGRHPASQTEIAQLGLAAYFARYVGQLHELAAGHGLRMACWADMFVLLPAAIPLLPRGLIAYDWYYHGFRRHPRFELYNYAEYNLAPALRQQGISYWGCPLNGAFRHEPMPVFGERLANALSWWQRCARTHAEGMLVTGWEPNRLALELTTVVDAAIAGLWLTPGTDDHPTLLADGFRRALGMSRPQAQAAARTALASDDRAHAGYAKWEINDRWTVFAGRGRSAPLASDAAFFRRALPRNGPPAWVASLAWGGYLATRDLYVREAAHGALRARRLLQRQRFGELKRLITRLWADAEQFEQTWKDGRTAAQTMWRRTRRRNQPNPNEQILQTDRIRLLAWRRWLRRAQRTSAHAAAPSPVAGAWHLLMVVHNVRPGLHRVVLQQRNEDGDWDDLAGRYTIEFRSRAARRRSAVKQAWSVPVPDPEREYRVALRGIGEVAISQVRLTDGLTERPNQAWRWAQRRRLGRPTPRQGWPDLNWQHNLDCLQLRF